MNEEAFDYEWPERDEDWLNYPVILSTKRDATTDKEIDGSESTSKLVKTSEASKKVTEEEAYRRGHVCAICLLPWTQRTYLIDCMHSFCFDCIASWLKQQKTCPLCKQPPRSVAFFATFNEHTTNDKAEETTERPLIQYTIDELEPPPCLPGKWHNRRSVYRHGLEPDHPPRKLTTTRIRSHHLQRLRPFIERELVALLGDNGQDDIVITYVIQVLLNGGTATNSLAKQQHPAKRNTITTSSSISSSNNNSNIDDNDDIWRDRVIKQLAIYLEDDATVFLREIITFLQSGRDMKTFDNTVSYKMTKR
jgi:hypothetical protein